jgi:hypothetical protein
VDPATFGERLQKSSEHCDLARSMRERQSIEANRQRLQTAEPQVVRPSPQQPLLRSWSRSRK